MFGNGFVHQSLAISNDHTAIAEGNTPVTTVYAQRLRGDPIGRVELDSKHDC